MRDLQAQGLVEWVAYTFKRMPNSRALYKWTDNIIIYWHGQNITTKEEYNIIGAHTCKKTKRADLNRCFFKIWFKFINSLRKSDMQWQLIPQCWNSHCNMLAPYLAD